MRLYIWAAGLLIALVPPVAGRTAETVTVVMVDDRFQPDHIVFRSGKPTELRLVNRGRAMHEFTALAFLHASVVRDKRLLSNGGGDIVVQAGQTVVVRLTPGSAGEYPLTCADHDWDGMVGTISVVR
jgi:plastocyanin